MDTVSNFEDVSPFKELLYECLEAAIIDTRKHFEDSKHRYDVPGLFAKHVRSKLHDLLEPEATSYGFSIDTSTGSFLIAYKTFLIKLYKAYNGMLPIPSKDSKARLQFFKHNKKILPWPQPLPGFEDLEKPALIGAKIHLVAYYDLSSKYQFSWLKIACPLGVTSTGVECLWNELVENPLSKMGVQPQKRSIVERPDIPITLLTEDNVIMEDNDLEENIDDSSGLS